MGLNVLVQKRAGAPRRHPHRRIEPLTPRSRISLRHPPEGRTEHAAIQGWRPSAVVGDDGAASAFGDHDGPRPLQARRALDDGLQATRRGRHRGADRRPARRPLRAGPRRRAVPGVPRARRTSAVVGNLPGPCNPAGLAFGPDGRLYIADSGRIMVLRPDAGAPPTATVFATGVPGSNGVAFDRRGDLWVTDGGTAQGRVWRIGRDGVPQEVFRVQPLANDVVPGGIGRDVRGLPPGTITITDDGPPGLEHARLPAPGGQRHRVRRRRRRRTSPTPPAARSGACAWTTAGAS